MKKIYLGADHGGFKLKEALKKQFDANTIDYEDLGAHALVPTDDYPNIAYAVATKVAKTKSRGILICRNGIGVCVVANKVSGIRAVSASQPGVAKTAREDDDANILCLGQDFTSFAQAKKIVDAWLKTSFSNQPRHRRRLGKIKKIEQGKKP